VAITWDKNKAKSNHRKHGVFFADAVLALDDPCALTINDYESDPEEERFVTLGCDIYGRALVVVYTYRRDDIRIISARPATPQECEKYRRQR
jgi:uncharacterized protein